MNEVKGEWTRERKIDTTKERQEDERKTKDKKGKIKKKV
jgi:hypothetical protein